MDELTRRDETRIWFLRLATQYYATGRFAALGHITPVGANLLHHAVEMGLKGLVAQAVDLAALKALRHSLTKIWQRTKGLYPTSGLGEFDRAIERLHRFEAIRYPDNLVVSGASILSTLQSTVTPQPKPPALRGVPYFELVVGEIDRLVARIFELADVNAEVLLMPTDDRVLVVINEQNEYLHFGAAADKRPRA